MRYSALTVSDELLKIAKRQGKQLTPMQLVKLVYIAHGWGFPIRGHGLLSDRIEAWRYGPIIPDLYRATKHYGRDPIPLDLIKESERSAVDDGTLRYLEQVFARYGDLSGPALSSLTHKSGTPWDQVYEDGAFGLEIPERIIREHYNDQFTRRGAAAA